MFSLQDQCIGTLVKTIVLMYHQTLIANTKRTACKLMLAVLNFFLSKIDAGFFLYASWLCRLLRLVKILLVSESAHYSSDEVLQRNLVEVLLIIRSYM